MSLTLLKLTEAAQASRSLAVKPAVRAAAIHNQEAQDIQQGFRRISGSTNRDLTPLLQDRMFEVAWYLWERNLLAKKLVNFFVEFIVGEGIRPRAEDERVQELFDRFWADPVNRMKLELPGLVRELHIFGEQVLTAHVNPVNGHVRLGYIDPFDVEEIVWGGLSPEGDEVALPLEVVLKSKTGKPGRRLKIIGLVEDPGQQELGFRAGDCFLFSLNRAKRGTRGRSELFAAADYIDGYDQLLFSALERFDVATRVFEDIKLEGMTEEEIQAWLQKPENRVPPKPLSKRAHNERVTYSLVSPNLGAYELENAGAKLFRNFVLGGAGIPEAWFASGGETNLSTLIEQGTPTFKMFSARQQFILSMLEDILNFVIDRAQWARALPEDVDRKFVLEAPELSVRDATKISGALQQVTFGLQAAVSEGWLTEETAARIFAGMVSQLGFPVDVEEEQKKLAQRVRPDEIDLARKPFPAPAGKVDDKKFPEREGAER